MVFFVSQKEKIVTKIVNQWFWFLFFFFKSQNSSLVRWINEILDAQMPQKSTNFKKIFVDARVRYFCFRFYLWKNISFSSLFGSVLCFIQNSLGDVRFRSQTVIVNHIYFFPIRKTTKKKLFSSRAPNLKTKMFDTWLLLRHENVEQFQISEYFFRGEWKTNYVNTELTWVCVYLIFFIFYIGMTNR